MPSPIDRLQKYKEKIQNCTILDRAFGEFIAIEVLDFISKDNPEVAEIFNKRLNYLKNLAVDKEFNQLQDEMFEATQKILKLVNRKQVEELQKEYKYAIISPFKGATSDFIELPELYDKARDKQSYYRLGDSSSLISSEGEISFLTTTIPIKKQFERIEGLLNRIISFATKKNPEQAEGIDALAIDHNATFANLSDALYRVPKKMHFENFERFFLFCAKVYPIPGYEFFNSFFNRSLYSDRQNKTLKEIKEDACTVMDDLIAELEIPDSDRTQNLAENQKPTIYFTYNKQSTPPAGILSIGNLSPIQFTKIPAQILYFFNSAKSLNNKNVSYRDFNTFTGAAKDSEMYLTSDDFRRKIELINKRTCKASNGLVKELIVKAPSRTKQEATLFQWCEDYK